MLGGLKAGKFDAIMAVPEWQFAAESEGFGRAIYDVLDARAWNRVFGGPIPVTVGYVLKETVEKSPDLVQAYVNATYRAQQWIRRTKDEEIVDLLRAPYMDTFKPEDVLKVGALLQDDLRLGLRDRRARLRERDEGVAATRGGEADPLRPRRRHVVRPPRPGQVHVLSARRPRIIVRHLAKTFREGARGVEAVHDVSFEVADKEFVAIVGPSGCGKSTILNMLGGLVPPSEGAIELDGRPGAAVPPNVGYVFQKDTVFPWRTVRRNIALGLEYRGVRGDEQERRVREGVRRAGRAGVEGAFPATLSGGMRQRVALMRTLVVD